MTIADLTVAPPDAVRTEAEPGLEDDFEAELEQPPAPLEAPVTEAELRSLLEGGGDFAHVLLGDEDVPDHWCFTDDELDGLVPPLTRLVNRRPSLQRAVRRGDVALVAIQFAGYLGRNLDDGRQARKVRDAHEHGEALDASGGLARSGPRFGRAGEGEPGGPHDGGRRPGAAPAGH